MNSVARRILAVLVVAALGGVASESRAEEWTESFTFDGKDLRVANLIGEIQIEGARGSGFEIEVRVQGRDAGRDVIRIDEDHGRNPTLAVRFPVKEQKKYVYPPMGNSRSSFSLTRHSNGDWWKEALGLFSGDKIEVSGTGRGMEVWADIRVRVPRGSRLVVEHGVGHTEARNVDGDLNLNTRSGSVDVDGITGEVMVDTGSGGVMVSNVNGDLSVDTGSGSVGVRQVEGELNIDTGSGSVKIEDTSGARVLVDTGSGEVTLDGISCRSLSVDTGSGGITAGGIRAEEATLDTGSGSVLLELAEMARGDIEIDTGSGSIDLRLPASASATVYASTGSGGIDVNADDVHMLEKSRDEKRFEIGDGRGSRINLETGSGSIRVTG